MNGIFSSLCELVLIVEFFALASSKSCEKCKRDGQTDHTQRYAGMRLLRDLASDSTAVKELTGQVGFRHAEIAGRHIRAGREAESKSCLGPAHDPSSSKIEHRSFFWGITATVSLECYLQWKK